MHAAINAIGRALHKLGSLLTQFQNAQVAMKALTALFDTPNEYQDEKAFISRESFDGSLEFKNVSFKYPNSGLNSCNRHRLNCRQENTLRYRPCGLGKINHRKASAGSV